eukprot:1159391-Pelagomonas_calceolata.AAC.3
MCSCAVVHNRAGHAFFQVRLMVDSRIKDSPTMWADCKIHFNVGLQKWDIGIFYQLKHFSKSFKVPALYIWHSMIDPIVPQFSRNDEQGWLD